ncbi:MAG: hypothetical protein Kow0010_06620 [Dehalococcoidia bacterium]
MITAWLFQLAIPLAGRFPGPFYRLAAWLGRAAWYLRPRARARVVRNLLPACDGNIDEARRQSIRVFQNVARYYVDMASIPYRDLSTFEQRHIRVDHPERLEALFAPGPVLIVSAHVGNPELMLAAIHQRGRPFAALVEALPSRAFSRALLRLRQATGGSFYESTRAGIRGCLEELQEGGLVALMGDRDIQGTGICVTLFGRRVKLPRGPWEMARRTGATVVPMFAERRGGADATVYIEEPRRIRCTSDPERDVEVAAQEWAALLERYVRRMPGQWTVLEDFWRIHSCGEG